MEREAQRTWTEYARRKRAERLSEAGQVWSAARAGGIDDATLLAIDFVHFGPSQANVEHLREALEGNCRVSIEAASDGYWLLRGTTRPYGVTLSADDHLAWVDYMCEVASLHGCVFSTWSLEAPSLNVTVSSEAFEGVS